MTTMVGSRLLVVIFLTTLTTLDIIESSQVKDRDILGLYSQTSSRFKRQASQMKSTGNENYLLCHCLSAKECPTGIQTCKKKGDYCMTVVFDGQVRAAGCSPSSMCTSSALTCCSTNMCNTLPSPGVAGTTMKPTQDRERTAEFGTNATMKAHGTDTYEATPRQDPVMISTEEMAIDAISTTRKAGTTSKTYYETTSSGLTSTKCSHRVLIAFLTAVTLNFYERK